MLQLLVVILDMMSAPCLLSMVVGGMKALRPSTLEVARGPMLVRNLAGSEGMLSLRETVVLPRRVVTPMLKEVEVSWWEKAAAPTLQAARILECWRVTQLLVPGLAMAIPLVTLWE